MSRRLEHVQELEACCFELLHNDGREAFQKLVAQAMVVGTLLPQAAAVESNGARRFDGASIDVPTIGRHQPVPAQNVALRERLDGDRSSLRSMVADRNLPFADEVEPVCVVILRCDCFARFEDDVPGTADEQVQVFRIKVFEEGGRARIGSRFDMVMHLAVEERLLWLIPAADVGAAHCAAPDAGAGVARPRSGFTSHTHAAACDRVDPKAATRTGLQRNTADAG